MVRESLHVVLAMSPLSNAFRNRVRKFPAIVNCCTIDWFQSWPTDALLAVASKCVFFQSLQLNVFLLFTFVLKIPIYRGVGRF